MKFAKFLYYFSNSEYYQIKGLPEDDLEIKSMKFPSISPVEMIRRNFWKTYFKYLKERLFGTVENHPKTASNDDSCYDSRW